MQAEGHVALARLFGPGAAEYSLPPEDANSEPQTDRRRITYDELCDARSTPSLPAELARAAGLHDSHASPYWSYVPTATHTALCDQVGIADRRRGDASRRGEVAPTCHRALFTCMATRNNKVGNRTHLLKHYGCDRDARLQRRWPDDSAGSRQSVSDFLAEVQQRRESRRRDAKARRAVRRQAAAGQRGAAASDAVQQARKARRMEVEAAMLRRRAAAAEERAVSAAATADNVGEHLSPKSVVLQVPQGSVRVTAGRKRQAPSADHPVLAASLPFDAGRFGHHGASGPDAASDSSQSGSSGPDGRSGSPEIGDGSDADSASAFEFAGGNDASSSGAAQEPQEGGEEAAARLQGSGDEPRSTPKAAPARGLRAWGFAVPRISADPATDDDSAGSPGMRKLRRGMLRRSRELLALPRHGLETTTTAAAVWDSAAAGSAALDTHPARGQGAADVPGEHTEHPEQHRAAGSSRPANTIRFWLYPPSSSCGVLPSSAGSGAQEQPDMQDLDSEQQQAGDLAIQGADIAARLLGAQCS